MRSKIITILNKATFPIFAVSVFLLGAVAHLFSLNRYNNFVYGKFDLGNMNQMLYNSARGNFMVLTDYFGQNVSRFSMSHVDPSLLIFIPINWFYSDASFLLLAQTLAFVISAFLVYFISLNQGLSKISSAGVGLLVMLMPISGYILVWTTFHSLILAMPFMLLGFYLGLVINTGKISDTKLLRGLVSKYNIYLVFMYFSFALAALSKEEIGFVLSMFSVYLFLKLKNIRKHIVIIGVTSFIWSLLCFLVIIPSYSQQRVNAVDNFINGLGGSVDDDSFEQLRGENYFLYRYSQFGDSYVDIATNLLFKPVQTFSFVFSEENLQTFNRLLLPVGYLPLLTPIIFLAALPELAIQVLAGEEGVFSITNHRLLILIPIFVLSLIELLKYIKKYNVKIPAVLVTLLVFFNIYLGFVYKNPLIYPFLDKAIKKVYAINAAGSLEFKNDIDATCATFLVNSVSDSEYVSVPQPLGAKTSNKTFNALFPAGLSNAEFIITDVYARKLVDFIDISTKYNKEAVQSMLDQEDAELAFACNRFFLLKKSSTNTNLGSITVVEEQEYDLEESKKVLDKSYLIDFTFTKISPNKYSFVYTYKIGDESDRKSLFAYTLLTDSSGAYTSFVHYPSYYLIPLNDFPTETVVREEVIYTFNSSVISAGEYNVNFGIGNRERNEENVFAGSVTFD